MKFDEARAHVISAVHLAAGSLNESHIWNKLAGPDDVKFSEMEIDSLSAMQICLEIEEKTGIEIDLGDLARYPSVNALAEFMVGEAQA
jgi:acyl carrier protein